jgi:hypothetical protein
MDFNYVYALNYIIAIAWVLSIVYSLVKLRKMEMDPTSRAIWGAVIVLVPFIGAIAFLITMRGQEA